MSIVAGSKQKIEKENNIISPFIIISLCALTLSIFSLLILIIYLHYQKERIVDIRAVSKQYHEVIHTIIKDMNLENDFRGYKELLSDKKLVIDGEYDIYIPSVDLYEGTVKALKKKIFEVGIGVETVNEKEESTSLLVELNNVRIAKLNIHIREGQTENEKSRLIKNEEVYTLVKNLLLSKYVSKTELMESLPEPVSDGDSMWFHKKMSLFLSENMDEKILLDEIKDTVIQKIPNADIGIYIDNENNIVEQSISIDNKKLLTVSIQKFSDNFNRDTTSALKTSLSVQFPFEKYIDSYFEPVLFYADKQSLQRETYYSDEKQRLENDEIVSEQNKNEKPKIAVILDDGGYRDPAGDPALDLINKINISILPDIRFTKELAKKAEEKGFEIMLHMPMQTKQGVKKGSFLCELLINMSAEEIKQKTESALEQVPGAVGVNNHTGGVFTLKDECLKSFMKVLKEKKMFFIDSVVVSGSKAYSVAKEEGVSTLQRDIFLDHEYTTTKIKESLETLKKIAIKKGKAVGIGHFRDLTIKVLQEELPKLEKQGFELVHVSELFE